MNVLDTLAIRLRDARISAGFASAEDLAKALGVRAWRYKRWEGGSAPIPLYVIPLACGLTGADPNCFYAVHQRESANDLFPFPISISNVCIFSLQMQTESASRDMPFVLNL